MDAFSTIMVLVMGALVGAGVVLAFRSWRSPDRPFPSCGKCGYDLSGTLGADVRCPECGAMFAEVGVRPPTTGRRRRLLVTGIVLAGITLVALGAGVFGTRMAYVRAVRAQQQAIAAQQMLQQQIQMQADAARRRAEVAREVGTATTAEPPEPERP